MDEVRTYWNGEPAEARKVTVTVADAPDFPAYWARPYVGMQRHAVEVHYGDDVFYLDDDPDQDDEQASLEATGHGPGWLKVTDGHGGPRWRHRNLTPEPGSVVERE